MTVKHRQHGNRSILLMMCLWFLLSRGETAEAVPSEAILGAETSANAIAQTVSQEATAQITNIRLALRRILEKTIAESRIIS